MRLKEVDFDPIPSAVTQEDPQKYKPSLTPTQHRVKVILWRHWPESQDVTQDLQFRFTPEGECSIGSRLTSLCLRIAQHRSACSEFVSRGPFGPWNSTSRTEDVLACAGMRALEWTVWLCSPASPTSPVFVAHTSFSPLSRRKHHTANCTNSMLRAPNIQYP